MTDAGMVSALCGKVPRKITPPMTLTLHALRAFEDNYIWTLAAADGSALVVDPGDAAPVLAAAAQGLRPVAMLLTHHHADHTGGVAELRRHWPVHCYAPVDARIADADVDTRVSEGDRIRIDLLGLEFDVMFVPGHTRSHIAFHGGGRLFCGDTLFSLGCGRMFEGTPAQMLASLDRLAALPDTTQLHCGHEYTLSNARFALEIEPGNAALLRRHAEAIASRQRGEPTLPASIGNERAANPFLRTSEAQVIAAATRRLGRAPRDRVETFAVLRDWKDGFRG